MHLLIYIYSFKEINFPLNLIIVALTKSRLNITMKILLVCHFIHTIEFQEGSSHISIQQIVQMKILDERVVSCIFLHTKIEVYKWSEADWNQLLTKSITPTMCGCFLFASFSNEKFNQLNFVGLIIFCFFIFCAWNFTSAFKHDCVGCVLINKS